MRKVTKYVFDSDGVVCTGGFFTTYLEREHGISPAKLSNFFKDIFPDCIIGKRDLLEDIAPLLPEVGWSGDAISFLDFWFERENVLNQDILNLLAELKGRKVACYLGTNQEKYRLAYMRNEMGFGKLFDHIFASCEMGCKKPDRQFFDEITTELQCRPEEMLLIDDRFENIAAALECHWLAVHYQGFSNLERFISPRNRRS